MLKFTGADGIMIGRAAQGRPWIFAHIAHYLATGMLLPRPDPQWIGDLLEDHLEGLYSLYGSRHGVRIARKHIAWYSRDMRDSSTFRRRVNQAATPADQQRLIRQFFLCREEGEKQHEL